MATRNNPWFYPLPKPTMEDFVRRLMAPIEKGQSLVLILEAKSGRRALSKFFIANTHLFTKQIRKGPNHYKFFFIDPPELPENSPLGYLMLLYSELNENKLEGCPSTYGEIFSRLKEKIKHYLESFEVVFFLNKFDELDFMTESLANNLKALWQIDKTRIHFVFLPWEDLSNPQILRNYGELKEAIMENLVKIPPLSETDIEYVIDRQAYFLETTFTPLQRKAIKNISQGDPNIIKIACRLLCGEKTIADPEKYLADHYQIKLAKEERTDRAKPIRIDSLKGTIFQGNEPINLHLTGKEYDLLVAFLNNKGIILSRDKIAEILWGKDSYEKYSDWAIDQIVHQLREKLTVLGNRHNLLTVRGKGYRFVEG